MTNVTYLTSVSLHIQLITTTRVNQHRKNFQKFSKKNRIKANLKVFKVSLRTPISQSGGPYTNTHGTGAARYKIVIVITTTR